MTKKIKIRLMPVKKKNGNTVFIPMCDEFILEPFPTGLEEGCGISVEVDLKHYKIEVPE